MTETQNQFFLTRAASMNGRGVKNQFPVTLFLILLAVLMLVPTTRAEDGYDLWLRYVKVQDPALLDQYQKNLTHIVVPGDSPTAKATREELRRGLSGLLGKDVPVANAVTRDGAILVSAPDSSRGVRSVAVDPDRATGRQAERGG